MWPFLSRQSAASFADTEPTILLAHALDYWLPYIDLVAQNRVRALGRVAFENEEQEKVFRATQERLGQVSAA